MPNISHSGKTFYVDTEALGDALRGSPGGLACAFFWDSSPQGDDFWRKEFDARNVGGDFSPEAKAILRSFLRAAIRKQNIKKDAS